MPVRYIAMGMLLGAFAAGYGLWSGMSLWAAVLIYSGAGTLAFLLPAWLMLWREVRDHGPEKYPA